MLKYIKYIIKIKFNNKSRFLLITFNYFNFIKYYDNI